MTRLLKLVTIIFTIISLTSAQIVDTLNTPSGPVTQGSNVTVSWTLVAGVDATGKNGDLSATDSTSKNTIDINGQVPLAPKSFTWNVQVPPGTYTLGLNDGSGLKQSGELVVKAPGGTAPAPAPAPSGGASAPAPPASSSPAAPSSGSPPAGGAGKAGASGSTGAGSAATGSGSAPAGTGGASAPPPVSSPSSASSIFSGYKIVFSLLGVAIAMVQF